jgi:RNA polymerase sigma factor (sigma-70 family)
LGKQANTFLQVVEAHKGIIYKIAQLYCHNNQDKEDLVQEITVQLWKSFANYNQQFKYSTWIYRIALNVAISFYRRETKRKPMAQPLPDTIFNIEDDGQPTVQEQQLALLQQFIAELKELDRALVLLYLDGKSHRETAEIIGISETNVATKLGRIKEKLKQRFAIVNC